MRPAALILPLAALSLGPAAPTAGADANREGSGSVAVMAGPGASHDPAFEVLVSADGKHWVAAPVYDAVVDYHEPHRASFAAFEFERPVEVRVRPLDGKPHRCEIRPLSRGIVAQLADGEARFSLSEPAKLSVEFDGDRHHNLHLFASPPVPAEPEAEGRRVIRFGPGLHTTENHPAIRLADEGRGPHAECRVPSHTTVLLDREAVVQASLVVDDARDVVIRGHGIIDGSPWMVPDGRRREGDGVKSFAGIRITRSESVRVEGPIIRSPVGYLILGGESDDVVIRDVKGFNHHLWGDGIDMMACSRVRVDDVFLRTSDDCIAIYGSRWDFAGDSRDWIVENATLWADKAHPIHMGTHGSRDPSHRDTLANLVFRDIDILENDARIPEFHGALSVNAGDEVCVRDVRFEHIRVESTFDGELVNVRVIKNVFNPVPGHRVENILFKDIRHLPANRTVTATVAGYDAGRIVSGVEFVDIRVGDRVARSAADLHLRPGPFAEAVTVRTRDADRPAPQK